MLIVVFSFSSSSQTHFESLPSMHTGGVDRSNDMNCLSGGSSCSGVTAQIFDVEVPALEPPIPNFT